MNTYIKIDIEGVINEYSNYVFKIVNNIVNDKLSYTDKEEIVCSVFYLLWKNQDNIHSNLKSYIATITRNCCFEKLKSNDTSLYDEIDTEYNYDYDTCLYIQDLLKVLTEEERYLFNLYYSDGYKVKEISKILNVNVSTVKVRLHRIRKKLKEVSNNE